MWQEIEEAGEAGDDPFVGDIFDEFPQAQSTLDAVSFESGDGMVETTQPTQPQPCAPRKAGHHFFFRVTKKSPGGDEDRPH